MPVWGYGSAWTRSPGHAHAGTFLKIVLAAVMAPSWPQLSGVGDGVAGESSDLTTGPSLTHTGDHSDHSRVIRWHVPSPPRTP